jgi:hypothetical protein
VRIFANPLKRFSSRFADVPRKGIDHMWRASATAIGLSILAISATAAADEQCRSIKTDKARLACLERGASSDQGSNGEAAASTDRRPDGSFVDPVDWLKTENDKVSARLKGICRGC